MQNDNEKKRAEAKDDAQVYRAVIDSIEPDITAVDAVTFYASAAISLKRIADSLDFFVAASITDHRQKEAEMQAWAARHGFGDLWGKQGNPDAV